MPKTLGLLLSGGSAAPPGTTLGAGVLLSSLANLATKTWTAAYTPQTGDAVASLLYLCNGNGIEPITLTIGAASVTVRQHATANHGGTSKGAGVWIGTVRSLGSPSARDVTVSCSANEIGHVALSVYDLVGWGGSVGHGAADFRTGGTAVTGFGVSTTLLGSGKLLVGAGAMADADGAPLLATGWTGNGSSVQGTTAGSSIAASFFTRTGGDAGSTVDLTVVGGLAWTDFAVGWLEIL